MASPDEMIREAQFALQNAGPGSTDERKNVTRAKSYSRQIIRKYPNSIEASQARDILAQLGVNDMKPAPPPPLAQQALAIDRSTVKRYTEAAVTDEQWRKILQRFVALPSGKKKLLAWGLLLPLVVLIPFSIFVFSGLALFYALNLPMLKRHLLAALDWLESKK